MAKRTKMCFNVCQMLKNKKEMPTIFFYLTRVTVGGGQDGKWSHFPPLFFNPSLRTGVKCFVGKKRR